VKITDLKYKFVENFNVEHTNRRILLHGGYPES